MKKLLTLLLFIVFSSTSLAASPSYLYKKSQRLHPTSPPTQIRTQKVGPINDRGIISRGVPLNPQTNDRGIISRGVPLSPQRDRALGGGGVKPLP